jgi:hypothetical protein
MELVVVTWTVRLALVASLGVGAVSYLAGNDAIDIAIRSLLAALAFFVAARFLLDRLEAPEQRLARLQARRSGGRGSRDDDAPAKGKGKGKAKGKGTAKGEAEAEAERAA